MFGLFTPITYNTNLGPLLWNYYMSSSGANSFKPWGYNTAYNYYGKTYGLRNFYPKIYLQNYNNPIFLGKNYSTINTFNYPYTQTYSNISINKTLASNNTFVSNPSKITPTLNNFGTETVNFGEKLVNTAKKYKNCSEFDNSHKKFCINSTCKIDDPFDKEWCTDFVTYVAKETYKNQGMSIPSGFGSHDVNTLKNWAISKDCFIRTSNKSQKGIFIANNIKPGDIMIINENGASHTGFVTSIDKNSGIIHTIEGNRDDMVKEYSYSPNYPDLSGFIRLTS